MHQRIDTDPAIDAILERHDIPRRFFPAFYLLAEDGELRDPEFRKLLAESIHFKAAADEIVELFARLSQHLFQHDLTFQSLNESDYPLPETL